MSDRGTFFHGLSQATRRGARTVAVFGILVLSACSNGPGREAPRQSVLDILSPQLAARGTSGKDTQLTYVASFASQAAARDHAAAVHARGGVVESLDTSARAQKITGTRAQLMGIVVAPGTLLSADTVVRPMLPAASATSAMEDPGQLAEAVLTARKTVGIDALRSRFPQADGRGVKVAVFDTGIDFGVEGIQLEAYFDLTGFGAANPSPIVPATDAKAPRFAEGVSPRKTQTSGVLDEAALAKASLIPGGVDLDANEKRNDLFAYVVGENSSGLPAVWLDADRDGIFSQREELTDFNSTHDHLDLRADAAPSGARALAVTITSPTEIQFHAVLDGHGTSCGIIIAGDRYADGKLQGMAPKAKLVSYLLDATGQDIYTMDQLLRMFLHARDQKVDAISISYGFSTADLASARFLADFLDREIAAKGILIGMAAGNDGPGVGSAPYNDYIPHHGLAIGASISKELARGVYGWTGAVEDSIVYYSGVGPTRGGRQIPDISSPLMTWVRGQRATAAGPFYAFSGTSSATPALVGASAALISALKASGEEQLEPRLLKLALQSSARPIGQTEPLRQGAGVVDVAAAYDVYKKLAAELRAARSDAARRTAFAYELRASTPLEGRSESGEGLHYHAFRPTAQISVTLTEASEKLVDALAFFEALSVEHDSGFFETAPVLKLQANGGKLGLRFKPSALARPGVYTDLIRLRRPSDGLVLLTVPVVIELHAPATAQGLLAETALELRALDVPRFPIHLTEKSAVRFDAILLQLGESSSASLNVVLQNTAGHAVYKQRFALDRAFRTIGIQTPPLAAGDYEALLYLSFGQGAALSPFRMDGAFRLPGAKVIAAETDGKSFRAVIQGSSAGAVTFETATLHGKNIRRTGTLDRNSDNSPRPGFETELDLGLETSSLELGIRLGNLDRALHDGLAMEVTVLDSATSLPLAREWVDFSATAGQTMKRMPLVAPARHVRVLAYPNIVKWESFTARRIALEALVPVDTALASALKAELKPKKAVTLEALQTMELEFKLGEPASASQVPASFEGEIMLRDATGNALERLPFTASLF